MQESSRKSRAERADKTEDDVYITAAPGYHAVAGKGVNPVPRGHGERAVALLAGCGQVRSGATSRRSRRASTALAPRHTNRAGRCVRRAETRRQSRGVLPAARAAA